MIRLYQFPVSHYCEKVRWALAYKRLPHKICNVLPGLHIKKMRKLSGQSLVPVIKDVNNAVSDSAQIITYLDAEYPRFLLTPEQSELAAKACEWERWASEHIGPSVQVLIYKALLDRPDILLPMFAEGGPWYSKFYLKRAYPAITAALRKTLVLDEKALANAREKLAEANETLAPLLFDKDNSKLVGDNFSRADLAVAALWAPLFQPGKYGLHWPENLPLELKDEVKAYKKMQLWVSQIYARYR
ncbi:glutathione S-transferase family protein [Agaribacterium haliotis]|uniref:glutathione S-transferase family protein n=1 Tax=Agaribacterium haliotis TaxID=2013869 RepID=UPI000BB56057|nr:glutathione S-transferase family protein [Agaribacterium haliotis]